MSRIKYLAIGNFTVNTEYEKEQEKKDKVYTRYTYTANNYEHCSSPCLAKCGKKAFVCNSEQRIQAGLGSTFCEYYQRWLAREKYVKMQEKEMIVRGLVG